MSVIVKGMKMPTGNDELRLIIRSNGQVIISHKTYYEETEAVPVPPHGRLIDADALLNRLNNCMFPSDMVTTTAVRMATNWIKDALTVIPAEEGET